MTATIRAKFTNGNIVPLEPLDIEEGADLSVDIQIKPARSAEERRKRTISAIGAWKDREDIEEMKRRLYDARIARLKRDADPMTRPIKYLIDTDWVIDCLRGVPKTSERFSNLLPEGIGLSIVLLAELLDGVVGSVRRQDDERLLWMFLDDLEIITLDEETCLIFAEERVRLRAAGNADRRYGPADRRYLLSVTELTLLTNNRRHFGRIQGLDIISV